MWKSLEERNLAIIETVMDELGVSDIEELPAKVIELKASAQQSVYRTCSACGGENNLHEDDCPVAADMVHQSASR